jgi:hypothetical protein
MSNGGPIKPVEPTVRSGQYKTWEEAFLKESWKYKTDAEMASELNRTGESIALKRRAMGLVRDQRASGSGRQVRGKR